MSIPLLPKPGDQPRILANLDKQNIKKKGIRASDSRWDWIGPSIKYRGEDHKDHYLNRNSAINFLKRHNVKNVNKLSKKEILNEIKNIKKFQSSFSESAIKTTRQAANIPNPTKLQDTIKSSHEIKEIEVKASPKEDTKLESVDSLISKAKNGNKDAFNSLSFIYFFEYPPAMRTKEDLLKLEKYYEKEYGKEGPSQEINKSFLEFLMAGAKKGDAGALDRLGIVYEYGKCDVKKDIDQAIAYYKQAVDKGSAKAAQHLASCYMYEVDDKNQAFVYCKIGAERGDLNSLHNLARHYEEGWGVEKNSKMAKHYYKLHEEAYTKEMQEFGYVHL